LLDPHEPRAHAQAVAPHRHAQVVGGGPVPALVVEGILGIGRHERRCLSRGCPTTDHDCAGTLSLFVSQENQIIGNRRYRNRVIGGTRARDPKHRGIQDRRRKDMGFLYGERIKISVVVAAEIRVIVRIDFSSLIHGVIRRNGVCRGQVIVEASQAEIFIPRPHRIAGEAGNAGKQSVRVTILRTVGRWLEKIGVRQHAPLQIGNWNICIEVRAVGRSGSRGGIDHVARQQTLARLQVGHKIVVAPP